MNWSWIIVRGAIAFVGSLVIGGVYLASSAIAARGVKIVETACVWEQEDRYVATVVARNTEDVPKVVAFEVQGRFKPGRGRAWPDWPTRAHYAAVSKPLQLTLPARQEAWGSIEFEVPGTARFECSARASVAKQHRDARPHA